MEDIEWFHKSVVIVDLPNKQKQSRISAKFGKVFGEVSALPRSRTEDDFAEESAIQSVGALNKINATETTDVATQRGTGTNRKCFRFPVVQGAS